VDRHFYISSTIVLLRYLLQFSFLVFSGVWPIQHCSTGMDRRMDGWLFAI